MSTVGVEFAPNRSITYICGTFLSERRVGELDAVFATLHGRAACGGPHLDVTFNVTHACKRPAVRKVVRVAIDGSWRCASTLLPINCYGETFQ